MAAVAGVPVPSKLCEPLWPWVAKELFSLGAPGTGDKAESYFAPLILSVSPS